ncbi:MAG: hypothetical protein FWC15_00465 [Fibromonadales bacterium]|nr:hypothetical protein [Fibromonadales bacterium]
MITDPNDLLPPDWQHYGYSLDKSIDPKILEIYGAIKERYPDVWVNAIDGRRMHNWCGLRSPACSIGAKNSYHKKGMAIDLHITQKKIMLLYAFCTSAEALALCIKRVENIDVTQT